MFKWVKRFVADQSGGVEPITIVGGLIIGAILIGVIWGATHGVFNTSMASIGTGLSTSATTAGGELSAMN